jgi:hypothetical protein
VIAPVRTACRRHAITFDQVLQVAGSCNRRLQGHGPENGGKQPLLLLDFDHEPVFPFGSQCLCTRSNIECVACVDCRTSQSRCWSPTTLHSAAAHAECRAMSGQTAGAETLRLKTSARHSASSKCSTATAPVRGEATADTSE